MRHVQQWRGGMRCRRYTTTTVRQGPGVHLRVHSQPAAAAIVTNLPPPDDQRLLGSDLWRALRHHLHVERRGRRGKRRERRERTGTGRRKQRSRRPQRAAAGGYCAYSWRVETGVESSTTCMKAQILARHNNTRCSLTYGHSQSSTLSRTVPAIESAPILPYRLQHFASRFSHRLVLRPRKRLDMTRRAR